MSDINVSTPPKAAEELSGMAAFLFIISFVGALATWMLFQNVETSIHEIEVTLIGLTSVITFCAAAVISQLNRIRQALKAASE